MDRLNAAGALNAKGQPWNYNALAAVLYRLGLNRPATRRQHEPEARLAA